MHKKALKSQVMSAHALNVTPYSKHQGLFEVQTANINKIHILADYEQQ